jgi:hypothetical protein
MRFPFPSDDPELRSLVTRSTESSGVRNFFSRLPTGLKLLYHGQTDPVQVIPAYPKLQVLRLLMCYSPQFTLTLRTEDLPNAQPIAWEVGFLIYSPLCIYRCSRSPLGLRG